jgi:DNA polymerase II small subunit/DNA polymerase delta subunit B
MPVYEVGGLVWWRGHDHPEDWNAVGLILEMRHMAPRAPDALVLWNDMPKPSWAILADLVPMQPDGDRGITG